jgi:hypothetical protein
MNVIAEAFRNAEAVLAAIRRAAVNLIPPKEMLPSEWAEANVSISVGNAIPGPINFDNAPYQRGMLDAVKEPGVRRVSYMTGAQLGKTTVQQCAADAGRRADVPGNEAAPNAGCEPCHCRQDGEAARARRRE